MRALAIIVVLAGCPDEPPAPIPRPKPRVVEPPEEEPTPHRLYPVAGSVVASEPVDRGPPVPRSFQLPARRSLRWTTHAVCELDENLPTCGPDDPAAISRYRVGRGTGVVVVEKVLAARVEQTWVFEAARRVTLDRFGRPTNLVVLRNGRFTSRERDGGNGLKGCGAMAYELDRAGRIVELTCVRRDGTPTRDTDGVAIRRWRRDERGRTIEESRFDSDGKRVTGRDHAHRAIFEDDTYGRRRVERARGVDDVPVPWSDGCFSQQFERDEAGQIIRTTCLGADDRAAANSNGVAHHVTRFDANGCLRSQRYLGPAGEAVLDEDGVHGVDFLHDVACLEQQRTCVDLAGKAVRCGAVEPARYVSRYDRYGRVTSTKHYGPRGNPIGDPLHGVFEVRSEWDDADRQIATSCHDASGKAIECGPTSGFHLRRFTYDAAGRLVEQRYFDKAGVPTHNHGSIGNRFRHDEYDRVVEQTNLETDGTTVDFTGAKTRRNVYDAYHRISAVLMFDRDGRPARFRSCFTGTMCPNEPWHAVRVERRSDGRVERNLFFDHEARLIKTVHCTNVPCFE
jgi:uncharacterized protein YjhX (UPF0386 family)